MIFERKDSGAPLITEASLRTRRANIGEEFVEQLTIGRCAFAAGGNGYGECGAPLVKLETFSGVLSVDLPCAFVTTVD